MSTYPPAGIVAGSVGLLSDRPEVGVAQHEPGRRDRQRGGAGVVDPDRLRRAGGGVRVLVIVVEVIRLLGRADVRAGGDGAGEDQLLRAVVGDVEEAGGGVLGEVQRVDEAAEARDAGLGLGDVALGVGGEDHDVVAAAVADDHQLAVERAVKGVALVLDDAVRRVVAAEDVGRAAVVRVGLGADGVLRELLEIDAAGGVAAVHDELAAGGVRVAVVAALDDVEEEVVLDLVDVGDAAGPACSHVPAVDALAAEGAAGVGRACCRRRRSRWWGRRAGRCGSRPGRTRCGRRWRRSSAAPAAKGL